MNQASVPAKYWLYEDTGADCWGYYLLTEDDQFITEFSDFETKDQARRSAVGVLSAVTSYKPEYDRYEIHLSTRQRFQGYFAVTWFDTKGNQLHTDEPFIQEKDALLHAETIWAVEHRELRTMPPDLQDTMQAEAMVALMEANIHRARMGVSWVSNTKSFDEKWKDGIKGFLPDFDFA